MSPKGNGSPRLSDHKTTSSGGTRTNSGGGGTRTPVDMPERAQTPGDVASQRQDLRDDDRGFSTLDRAVSDQKDPVEVALADALTKATIAGRFDVVKALVGELAARRAGTGR